MVKRRRWSPAARIPEAVSRSAPVELTAEMVQLKMTLYEYND